MTANTNTSLENCTSNSYTVEKNDTLASIADRFAISAEDIVESNSLQAETVMIGQILVIPGCASTPTDRATAYTTMITPVLYTGTIAPGGY
jgi:LysM repeat protein